MVATATWHFFKPVFEDRRQIEDLASGHFRPQGCGPPPSRAGVRDTPKPSGRGWSRGRVSVDWKGKARA